ncbi:MAG: vWA domain-containing protein [Betaproteobacteria bacterium]
MRFLHPGFAWWLLAALAGVGVLQWTLRRRFAASTTVRWLGARAYRASPLRRLPFVLVVASLVLVGLALMEPVIPYSQTEVRSRGLDIVMVLDLSSSMEEEMNPAPIEQLMRQPGRPPGKTRLEATKNAIKTFIHSRRDDRIGLVVFSDHAYVVSPLTFDYDYLTHYVDMVDDRILQGEGQTAIGDGLALANYLLARQSRGATHGHQVIVLFTDGENNRGRDPVDVLGESADADIRVHMVGVDLEREVRDKPQVQRLLQMIQRNGGRYFNANSERDLVAASAAIDSIEKGSLVSKAYARDAPVYQWFALPALVCLAAAAGVRAIPYFVDQT